MPLDKLNSVRAQFEEFLSEKEVQGLLTDEGLKTLQCSGPVKPQTWELLNDQFFARRPDVELRVYGFRSSVMCDLSFTSKMTNIHRFSADALMDAVGVEHIAAMEKLESLRIDIYHLEGFGFLDYVAKHLKRLFLGRTKSKKPDLAPLSRLDSLEEIYIVGQQRHIEVLSQLKSLRDVTLRSISTPDISYLKPLDCMWSLDIKLGGIRDLYAIEGMGNIKYLELWQIRGLSDIGVISSLAGLQYLFLQSLRRVVALPPFERLTVLRRIYLENMRGLRDICSLEFAPALEEFIHNGVTNMQPEDYLPLLRNPHLKRAAGWLGSDKKTERFRELIRQHNIKPFTAGDRKFEFV
jgi:hypothetical protein